TNTALGNVSRNLAVVAYLDKEISKSAIDQVQDQLTSISGIKSSDFVSKEEAWSRLKSKFKYQEDIVSLVAGNPLPNSFVIHIDRVENIESVIRELKLVKGIDLVRYGQDVVAKIRKFVHLFNIIAFSVVGFLLLATFLITINTINLTILSKKNEVQIMKLVGATNSFIKWSFIVEGFIIGSLGALIAMGIATSLFHVINTRIQVAFPFIGVFTQGTSLVSLNLAMLSLGLFIGVAGSFLSIKNLLKSMIKK
ncbi:MAG: permease-like cell division protein FtsX, partial [Candidatus Margulisiibacteriota bacterium]